MLHLHFGLDAYTGYIIYFIAIVVFFLSIVWRPDIGVYFLVPLMPLQTIRVRLWAFPLGAQFVDVMLLGITIGLLIRQKPILPANPYRRLLLLFFVFTYISLWLGTFSVNMGIPIWFNNPRLSNWKNFMVLPYMFHLVISTIRTKQQMLILLLCMTFGVLALNKRFRETSISQHDYTSFSYNVRESGSMGYAGVNGLAAFEVQFGMFVWALSFLEKRIWFKLLWILTFFFCMYCTMYSLSRGAYVGAVAAMVYISLRKKPILLIPLIVLLMSWKSLVPGAVVERVEMTTNGETEMGVDSSAGERLTLWEDALEIIRSNPITGKGFNTYEFLGSAAERRLGLHDTHNLYIKLMLETGVIGLGMFLMILFKTYRLGAWVHTHSTDPFVRGIGFGTCVFVVVILVVNCFGDRWMYFQISGYTWTLFGLLTRCYLDEQAKREAAGPQMPQVIGIPSTVAIAAR